MKKWGLICVLLVCSAVLSIPLCGAEKKLTRIKTQPFGKDFKAYEPVRVRSLKNPGAVLVRIENGVFKGTGLEEKVQAKLQKAYGLSLPVMGATEAVASGKTMILIGGNNANLPIQRLVATMAENATVPGKGAELRVWPAILNWKGGAVYCSGRTGQDILNAVDQLVKKFPDPEQLKFYIWYSALPENAGAYTPEKTAKAIADLRDRLVNQRDMLPHQAVISGNFRPVFRGFMKSGHPSAARTFAEMQKVYHELYNVGRNDRNTPPSFTFCEYIWYLEQIEQSEAFTAEDRARAAELIRNVIEDCMNYYEMYEPMKNYAAGKRPYYTNHPIFASRTVWTAADYMDRHYRFKPAAYWKAVSENAIAGIEPHPIGPEDSAGYQHICYRIFTEFAIASGLYGMDFFHSPKFTEYIRYIKAQYSPMLFTPGHGDNNPLGGVGGLQMLCYAYNILGDQEALSIMNMVDKIIPGGWAGTLVRANGASRNLPIKFSDDLLGLQCFMMDDFRLTRRNNIKYSKPVLDKAYFRSGWEADDDFLVISGVATAPHGHFDVNGILCYYRGQHVWLTDGDYIRVHPEEHNTLTLRADGKHIRPGANEKGSLSQVLAQGSTPDKKFSALELMAEEYGPVNWHRTVAGEMQNGFWVIDELKARKATEVQADFRWRSLGDMTFDGKNTVKVRQKSSGVENDPDEFYLSSATPAELFLTSQLDIGHGNRPGGYYIDYKYADRFTRVAKMRQTAMLKKDGVLRQAVFMGHRDLPVTALAGNAWMAGTEYLAIAGNYSGPGIVFKGGKLFVSPAGVIGFGVREVKIGDWRKTFKTPQDIALNEKIALPAVKTNAVALKTALPAQAAEKSLPMESVVSAVAAGPDGFGVGCEDGSFRVIAPDGKVRWSVKQAGAVETACGFRDGKDIYWAVSFNPANPQERAQTGYLRVYNGDGKELWSQKFITFHTKPGLVKTVFPAKLTKDGKRSLVIGLSGWKYEAYNLADGKRMWSISIYHGATCGTAADVDGDGLDEICAGSEYYWHWLVTSNGKRLVNRSAPPWDYAVGAVDLNKDGKPEFLAARSDSNLYIMVPDKHPLEKLKPLNIGGLAVGIQPLGPGRFAVAAANGRVLWADGDLQVTAAADLPGDITGFAQSGGKLYAAGADGLVYVLENGRVLDRINIGPVDHANIWQPCIAGNDLGVVAAVGKNVSLIK